MNNSRHNNNWRKKKQNAASKRKRRGKQSCAKRRRGGARPRTPRGCDGKRPRGRSARGSPGSSAWRPSWQGPGLRRLVIDCKGFFLLYYQNSINFIKSKYT